MKLRRRWQIAVMVISMILVLWAFSHDRMYCIRHYVDIRSGDLRQERYVGFVIVSDTIQSTPFSLLSRALLGSEDRTREWREMRTTDTLLYQKCDGTKYATVPAICHHFVLLAEMGVVSDDQLKSLLVLIMKDFDRGDVVLAERRVQEVALRTPEWRTSSSSPTTGPASN